MATPKAKRENAIKRQPLFHLPDDKHKNIIPENKKHKAVFIFMVVSPSRIVFNAKTSNNQPVITASAKTIVNRLTDVSNVGL